MQTIWLSPTNYVTGDPTLRVSYPFVSHPSTIVACTTPGDFKWVSMGLRLPPNLGIEEVIICYEVSNGRSFISQTRLAEMTTPDQATVIHDDPTHLTSTTPASYNSAVSGLIPTGAVTLELRLNFQNASDEILLGAVGVKIRAPAESCVNSIADLKALGAGVTPCLTVLGYYAPGDRGGGGFYWDPSGTETDNGGTIIVPASNPVMGRWKRLVDGQLSVKWFGAKGDGVNPDSSAIAAANTAAIAANCPLYFPSGAYHIISDIAITAPLAMQPGAVLSPSAANVVLEGALTQDYRAQQLFSGTGYFSSVSHTGSGPTGAVTVSGNPLGNFLVQIVIATGGALGTAQFKYTLNNVTYFAGFTTTAVFIIQGTGIILNFSSTTYVLNDIYSFTTVSPITLSFPGGPLGPALNPIWWGAKGDNSNDDTNAIQSAINNSYANNCVFLPNGTYKITQPLIITDRTLRMSGAQGGQTVGTQIIWHGADGVTTMVQAVNISESSFEHLSFSASVDSIQGCKYCFWIEEPIGVHAGGSTEVVFFNRCCFLGAVGAGSACFVIGRAESGDISEIRFVDCEFTGGAAGTATPTSVTAATNASPIQIATSTPHNLIEHQAVVVRDVGGNNAANVGAFIHIIDENNFQLIGTTGTGTYTSGGTVYGGGPFTTLDSNFGGAAIPTCEFGVLLNSLGNEKNFSFTNCTWRDFLKAGVYGHGNSGSLAFFHPVMGFNNGLGGLIADFFVSALQNLTIIGAETEGSARAVLGIGSQNPGTCVITGYSWNGFGVDSSGDPLTLGLARLDAVVYWNGQMIMTGCEFFNLRDNFTAIPYIAVSSDPVPIGSEGQTGVNSFASFGNYFSNATFLPIFDMVGGNNLIEWQDFAKGYIGAHNQCPIISRGDTGGDVRAGCPLHFPAYEGMDLRVGPQQLWVQFSEISLQTPDFAKINSGILTGSTAKLSVDYTDVQATSATNRFTLAHFPKRCRIISVIANTTVAWGWAAGSDSIHMSVGLTQANGGSFNVFNDNILLLSHDIKTTPVIKGLIISDLGADLAPSENNAFGWVDPDTWTFQLPVNAVFTSGGQNLSGLNAGHTDFYIRFEILPL